MRKEREGEGKKDAILVLTLLCVEGNRGRGGCTLTVVITWVLLLTRLIVAVSLCCRYGMSFFDLKFLKKKKVVIYMVDLYGHQYQD